MKKTKPEFEIYKAIKGRRTYLVFAKHVIGWDATKMAMKHFKVSKYAIVLDSAWILNNELYFENPHSEKAVKRYVAYRRSI